MKLQSPSQTVGPFFHYGLLPGDAHILADESTWGEPIWIRGRVLDGDGEPVEDALLEIWQADAQGYFAHPADPHHLRADPNFRGFGRSGTAGAGFAFRTIKPGVIPQMAVPFINVRVFARGMLVHAVTRLYFSDHDNAADPVFAAIAPARQKTLLALRTEAPGGVVYRWDVRLQGPDETVFFDLHG